MGQILTSISGLPISAASAGFSPTNSADVSAIASGYQVVSATATQLYAGTAYLTSVNDAPVSASRAGNAANASMANSAYYDGTGRLISSLPDEATVSSIASSYAESAASGKLDTTAQVVTSTSSAEGLYYDDSGNLSSYTAINALNGSALSAIASLSAVSAVVSTDASYANSADVASFDENYRALTAMAMSSDVSGVIDTVSANSASWGQAGVDSATVSAIASAYVESGVSGKLDSTAFNSSDFYGTGNESGFVDSGYVDSAVSGKQDSSAMSAYALSSDVSGVIDTVSSNSASWGGGGGGGDYVENSALDSATVRTAIGSAPNLLTGVSSISGKPLIVSRLVQPTVQYASASTFLYMPSSSPWSTADVATGVFSPLQYAAGACLAMDSERYFKAYYKGNEWFAADTRYGMVRGEVHGSRGIRIVGSGYNSASGFQLHPSGVNGVGANGSAWKYGTAEYKKLTSVHDTVSANSAAWGAGATGDYVEKSATEVAIGSFNTVSRTAFAQGFGNTVSSYSFAQGLGNTASDYSFAQGYDNTVSSYSFAQGHYNIATNTAAVFGQFNLRGDGDTSTGNSAAFAIGDGTGTDARHDLMLVTKDGEITMYSSTADTVGTGIMSSIRAISAAATGGVDSATVSAIASSYVESGVSAYQPLSGMSAYESSFSAGDGLEFLQSGSDRVLQVEAPVDIVAGPGIVIDNPDGNTLRVSVAQAEEVVLYDDELKQVTNNTPVSGNVLSETFRNFERVLLIGHTDDGVKCPFSILLEPLNSSGDMEWSVAVSNAGWCKWFCGKLNDTTLTLTLGRVLTMGTADWNYLHDWAINKVVGIHRTASN